MRGGAGCKPSYQIGSPLFSRISVHLNEAFYPVDQVVIEAEGNSDINRYVQSAWLNNMPLNGLWLFLKDLLSAGRLKLLMGAKPREK